MTLFQNKMFVAFGLSVLLFAAYSWVAKPVVVQRESLVAKLQRDKGRLRSISQMKRELDRLKTSGDQSKVAGTISPDFTLYGFLEQTTRKVGVYDSVESLSPQEKTLDNGLKQQIVSLKLKGATLRQLVEFIYHVERQTAGIQIDRLAIRTDKRTTNLLDFEFTASVYIR